MAHLIMRWIWAYLIFGWLASLFYNWYLIEMTIKRTGGDGPWLWRGAKGFPHVFAKHQDCPAELMRVNRLCKRWIYGSTAVLLTALYLWRWLGLEARIG